MLYTKNKDMTAIATLLGYSKSCGTDDAIYGFCVLRALHSPPPLYFK
jgi:hypothetical protein